MGHRVGVICDARRASPASETALRKLEMLCALGVVRIAMSRQLGLLLIVVGIVLLSIGLVAFL